jgi:DNA-binding beta-propeller fold protein YncE
MGTRLITLGSVFLASALWSGLLPVHAVGQGDALTPGPSLDASATPSSAASRGALRHLGCIGSGESPCRPARAMEWTKFLVLSSDGRHVYATARDSDAIAAFRRHAATGRLRQLPGKDGCVTSSSEARPRRCRRIDGLNEPAGIALSPNGRHAYVAANGSGRLLTFSRNRRSGRLVLTGCHADVAGLPSGCQPAPAMVGANMPVITPDGDHVYLASNDSDAVVIFERNRATGALRPSGCIADPSTASATGCEPVGGLLGAYAVTVSHDGTNVYVAAPRSSAVVALRRDPISGALTSIGCWSGDRGYRQDPACAPARSIEYAQWVLVSRDGRNIYVSATDSHTIGVFRRTADTGSLRQLPGRRGCLRDRGYPNATRCRGAVGLALPMGTALGRQGSVLYATEFGYGTVSWYRRNVRTGALRQFGGCLSASDPRCRPNSALWGTGHLVVTRPPAHVYTVAPGSNAISTFRIVR